MAWSVIFLITYLLPCIFQMLLYVSNYMHVNRSLIYSPQASPRDNNTITLFTIMHSTLAYQHSPFTI
jgi:hypothetical protein